MNRHYDGTRVREVLEKLRQIQCSNGMSLNIGADLIVGFPGESDGDFADTLECVTKYNISQLHAFPFSAHVDHYSVPAGVYPDQVPNHIAQSRIKSLQRAGTEVFTKWAEETVGREVRVLVEKVSISPLRKALSE
jgi:threonylcarbamoyladenosine tRNA methylthiotransferase MtaB